jgi:ribosomal subunit interface protein
MNLNLKTTNISLSQENRDYFEKKLMMLDKLVDFSRDNVFVYAELAKTSNHHRSGDIFRAEVNMQLGGRKIYAAAEKENLYAAIDEVKDQLEQEIKTSKDKRISLIKRGARAVKNMLRFGNKDDSRGSYGR